ncbi:g_PROTEIN_RECEP_F1_2 domain-containing protein [Nephila pilipes]|uniref:G_PROTEIN_RECEP_F1_2 domain-containing protein n=1 Tax=Nephila pilipes TaxID=299642 RepID=A0A8X6PI98_NEPPI|nr:g_PROTEIN_RECEP_F1_2 domain-containing protein [Nephila pilipes]
MAGIIFHVESHPIHKDFKQCVSFHFFKAEYQKVLYNIFCVLALYGGPLMVFVYCYSRVMWVVCKRSKLTQDTPSDLNDSCSHSSRCTLRLSNTRHIDKTRSRTLKMTCLIVFSFFCCWTPYIIIDLWYLFDSKSAESLDTRIQSSMFMFAVFNSCVNPLVYSSYLLDIKATLMKLLHWPLRIKHAFRKSASKLDAKKIFKDPLGVEADLEYHLPTPEGIYLELQEASPVRQPVNREELLDAEDELELNSCESPRCSYCRSHVSVI